MGSNGQHRRIASDPLDIQPTRAIRSGLAERRKAAIERRRRYCRLSFTIGRSDDVNGGQKARKSGAGQKVGTKRAAASATFRRSTING